MDAQGRRKVLRGSHPTLPFELALARAEAILCRYLPKGIVRENDAAPVRTTRPVLWLAADGDPQVPLP